MSINHKFQDVVTVIGRTNTWACNLAILMFSAAWLYVILDLLIGNLDAIMGGVIVVLVSIIMFRLPVVQIIQPLNKNELLDYNKSLKGLPTGDAKPSAKQSARLKTQADLFSKNYVPITEFSKLKAIPEDKVIKMIRDGFYDGQLRDGVWYVNRHEIGDGEY